MLAARTTAEGYSPTVERFEDFINDRTTLVVRLGEVWFYLCVDNPVCQEDEVKLNLLRHVYLQLPATLRDQFKIDVNADAFLIRSKASFTDPQGRTWETELENTLVEGVPMNVKIPETFLAQLCVVV